MIVGIIIELLQNILRNYHVVKVLYIVKTQYIYTYIICNTHFRLFKINIIDTIN